LADFVKLIVVWMLNVASFL
jgi:hypothetical protein